MLAMLTHTMKLSPPPSPDLSKSNTCAAGVGERGKVGAAGSAEQHKGWPFRLVLTKSHKTGRIPMPRATSAAILQPGTVEGTVCSTAPGAPYAYT